MDTSVLFFFLLMVIAFLYSSVGHGGASGYLALMAFFSFPTEHMRISVLLLNCIVSLLAFMQYYRNGYFQWKLFYPFALGSVPAAFLGGLISLDAALYKKILGVLLLVPAIKLFGLSVENDPSIRKMNLSAALMIGAAIGFLSGLIGIGGGIILSPVILLLHWAGMKQTAAVSALFIFLNSVAGITGISIHETVFNTGIAWMVIVALAGGLAGSYYGARIFKNIVLKKILAVVLVIASAKLIIT